MATAPAADRQATLGEHRFLLTRVDWQGYEALLRIVGNRKSVRVTYDRGNIELMSPLYAHDSSSYLLARMIDAITEELDIPVAAAGSSTIRRKDVDRGLEPDQSYYLSNFHRLAEITDRIDLDLIPPPDLVIEVEITSSLADRVGIYEAFGVPEIWRYDGDILTVLVLGADGRYAASMTSLAFPALPMGELVRFLREHTPGSDETRWSRSFRTWVREVVLPLHRAANDA